EKRVFLVILFTSFSGSLVSRISGAVQIIRSPFHLQHLPPAFSPVPGFLCIFLYLISRTHLATIPEAVLSLLLFLFNTMFCLVRCFFCPVRYFFGLLTGLFF
ncbi:hypothetical protein, partial [Escherichia coli]|uniref:hypothetical protein n=1 Tax=Escherichia coli TaxID=562 RepID=UPI00211238CE